MKAPPPGRSPSRQCPPGCRRRRFQNSESSRAFSLIELLIAAALGAALLTVAVIIFQNLVANGGTRTSYGTVTVGSALGTFYGGSATTVAAYFAPSYGRAAQAEVVRDQFVTDLRSAIAVYCLGRNGVNATRVDSIPVSAGFQGSSLDTPEAFRQLLASAVPATASTFTAYRGASTATNASIFILGPAEDTSSLSVLAIYDIDLTPTTSPAGTYASVKRYGIVATTGSDGLLGLTDYYDVFYPAPTTGASIAFNPLVVCFERAARAATVEGDAIDRLKQAAERPFYFVWWPDPAAHTLEAASDPGSGYASTDPKKSYSAMGGRTAFFLVVPMFPAL
jgi:hypothetical protein